MVVNFRTCEISRGTHKLTRTPTHINNNNKKIYIYNGDLIIINGYAKTLFSFFNPSKSSSSYIYIYIYLLWCDYLWFLIWASSNTQFCECRVYFNHTSHAFMLISINCLRLIFYLFIIYCWSTIFHKILT